MTVVCTPEWPAQLAPSVLPSMPDVTTTPDSAWVASSVPPLNGAQGGLLGRRRHQRGQRSRLIKRAGPIPECVSPRLNEKLRARTNLVGGGGKATWHEVVVRRQRRTSGGRERGGGGRRSGRPAGRWAALSICLRQLERLPEVRYVHTREKNDDAVFLFVGKKRLREKNCLAVG